MTARLRLLVPTLPLECHTVEDLFSYWLAYQYPMFDRHHPPPPSLKRNAQDTVLRVTGKLKGSLFKKDGETEHTYT